MVIPILRGIDTCISDDLLASNIVIPILRGIDTKFLLPTPHQ